MSDDSKALVPYRPDLNELRSVGQVLAASGFYSDCRRDAQAITKVLYGRELGLTPGASMTGIYIVKGRVSLSANAMAMLIQRYTFPGTNVNRFKYRVRKWDHKGCVLAFFERETPTSDWEEVGPSSFDDEDAKLAGLNGDNWKKYRRNMHFARAMSNGARMYCPAVFGGHHAYLPDEIDQRAVADDEGNYKVDGTVVQSMDVQDAEIIDGPETDLKLDENASDSMKELIALIQETATDPYKICNHYGVSQVQKLDEEAIANCKQMLLAKRDALAAEPTVN